MAVKAVGPALVRLRDDAGISREDAVAIARNRGAALTIGTLGNWERGRAPNLHKLLHYLESLGYTLSDLAQAHSKELEKLEASETETGLEEWRQSVEEKIRTNPRYREALAETLESMGKGPGKAVENGS